MFRKSWNQADLRCNPAKYHARQQKIVSIFDTTTSTCNCICFYSYFPAADLFFLLLGLGVHRYQSFSLTWFSFCTCPLARVLAACILETSFSRASHSCFVFSVSTIRFFVVAHGRRNQCWYVHTTVGDALICARSTLHTNVFKRIRTTFQSKRNLYAYRYKEKSRISGGKAFLQLLQNSPTHMHQP